MLKVFPKVPYEWGKFLHLSYSIAWFLFDLGFFWYVQFNYSVFYSFPPVFNCSIFSANNYLGKSPQGPWTIFDCSKRKCGEFGQAKRTPDWTAPPLQAESLTRRSSFLSSLPELKLRSRGFVASLMLMLPSKVLKKCQMPSVSIDSEKKTSRRTAKAV